MKKKLNYFFGIAFIFIAGENLISAIFARNFFSMTFYLCIGVIMAIAALNSYIKYKELKFFL